MNIELSEHFNYRKLIKFTIPSIIMMIFTSIYGVVDGIFVSNIVGSNAFASINLIMPALMIIGAIGFMFGTGGSALVSKTIGEGEKDKANQYFSTIIYFVIIVGAILSVIGFVFVEKIAIAFGAEGEILAGCVIYARILFGTLVCFMLQICFQSFLVVAEKPKLGLAISIMAGITNMVLDFLLIYVFKLGIVGAAIATGISEVVGGIVPLIYFMRKNNTSLKLTKTKFYGKALIKSATNGSSEMLTNISMSLVNMLYNMQLLKFVGTDGVVAYGIIMYISFIFVSVYIGYSIGTAPIVGYSYGAQNKEELKNLLRKSLMIIGITAVGLFVIAEVSSKLLASIFVSYNTDLLAMTTHAIQLYSVSFLFSGFNIFGSAFFTALNNGKVSAVISFLRTLLFQVGMIFLLPTLFGINGIWSSVMVAEILALIVTTVLFIINRKKYEYI